MRNPSHILNDAIPSSRAANHQTARAWLPAILAAVAALSLYAVTLGGSYVYDDVILHEDPRFTQPARWSEFWTKDYMPDAVDKLYRPLTCMTLAIQFQLHGDRPWLFHLVNWLLHAGAAAAVAELARRLLGFRVAVAAGVLFAVHPVHVEAVASLVNRAELLCTLAIAGGLVLFLKPMTLARAAAICICLLIAILSKEQGILFPAILLALVPFRRQLMHQNETSMAEAQSPAQLSKIHSTSDNARKERGVMLGLVAAICVIMAGYLILREQLLGFTWDRSNLDWTANPLIRRDADRWLMPLVLAGRYLVLLIFPLHLSLDYGSHVIGWAVNWREPYIYLGIAATGAGLIAIIASLRQRNWAIFFCLVALALSYGMVSNSIILIGTIFGERLMYLPSVFFLILVAALLNSLIGSKRGAVGSASRTVSGAPKDSVRSGDPTLSTRGTATFFVILTGVALLFSIRTFTYARLWNDPLALYLSDLHAYPKSMHLHGLATHEYIVRGDYHAARQVADDCRRELPDVWQSYQMCVAADLKLNDFADAEQVLAHVDPRCPGLQIAQLRSAVRAAREKSTNRQVTPPLHESDFFTPLRFRTAASGNPTTVSPLPGNTS